MYDSGARCGGRDVSAGPGVAEGEADMCSISIKRAMLLASPGLDGLLAGVALGAPGSKAARRLED